MRKSNIYRIEHNIVSVLEKAQSSFYLNNVTNEELDIHKNENYIYSWSSFPKWIDLDQIYAVEESE